MAQLGEPDAPLTLGYDSATGLGYGIGAAKGITVDAGLSRSLTRGGHRCPIHRQMAR